jgi:hypothetical protein
MTNNTDLEVKRNWLIVLLDGFIDLIVGIF